MSGGFANRSSSPCMSAGCPERPARAERLHQPPRPIPGTPPIATSFWRCTRICIPIPNCLTRKWQTAARVAAELKRAGAKVTTGVGKLGVVGLIENGPGPVVLVRTDMDALPVVEQTGLPYASKVKVRDSQGREVGVMHACGHDVHMTCFIGTARWLGEHKDRWSGTVVMVAQPAEEAIGGARNMLADGLYSRFPKPDFALALHCHSNEPAGTVLYRARPAPGQLDFALRDHPRQRRPWRLAEPHRRSHRPGGARHPRFPDDRQPRGRADPASRGHRGLDSRGDEAQHHLR